ncbi:MAG: efflux RND transporter periplasmic adaptor subunit [Gammaproteobacteria bacterium]|nr:efflux RND transporter periplasmic adaptor subunit [Gammaproteobacteria bacterium]
MSKPLYKIFFSVIFLLIIGGSIWALSKPNPITVTVTTVTYGDVEATVTNTRAGSIKACRRARLAPLNGGLIDVMRVTEGQRVSVGEILVNLWNKNIVAELALAKNEADAARARAGETCTRYDVAEKEARRQNKLLKQKLTSTEQAEAAEGNANAAKAACEATKSSAKVALSKIDVVNAALERTMVRAPFDGIVAEVNGEVGEFVTPSPVGVATLPVVDLIDSRCIYVAAPIDEVDAPAVKVGMSARVSLDAFPNHPFSATVHRIAPYVQNIEKQARTVDVEVYFTHSIGEQGLLPGYSADAEIILNSKQNVLHLPTEAIFNDNQVYVYHDNNTLKKKQIKTGIGNWGFTEIISGLTEGDRVVTSIGIEGLADGVTVQLSQDKQP